MRITINAFGSRGDVQPYLALARGLKGRGHEVRLLTHGIFEEFVRSQDLEFLPLSVNPQQVLVSQSVAEFGNNTFRITRWMKEEFKPVLDDVFQSTLDAALDADLLLNSSLSFAGWHVAQKLKIPAIAVYLQPATPTREYPSSLAPLPPSWLPIKGVYNYLSSKLSNQLFFYMLLGINNSCREEILDLPPLSMRYYWGLDSPGAKVPLIYGFSPAVVPKPTDWGDYQQITGYWFLDLGLDYQPPADLTDFLNSGPPPIYVGFGSMVDHEREEMTNLVLEALEQSGQRAILLGGWSELGSNGLPDSILRVESIPHDWLFPRLAAVVHHGGAGTTGAGLRAGLPGIIVPFFGDQHYWGWRLYELGAGPKWIPRPKLTPERLSVAILQAVNDEAMRKRAAQLGARIRNEKGVKNAVRLIEGFTKSYGEEWVI